MMEPLFGSLPPMWNVASSPPSGWAPINRPQAGPLPAPGQGPTSSQIRMSAEALGYGAGAALPMSGTIGASGAFPLFGPTELVAPTTALIAAVAMRRGQPNGPTNDIEIEDFLNDALDLMPGASEVEVRCENGRVTATGNVAHKRHKRDIGEIAWAIPSVGDVQNNLTIVTRRRARASGSGREVENAAGPVRKHA